MKKVLDVCCGSRMFYFNKNDDRVLFCDKRSEDIELTDRVISVRPDVVANFKNLPFADGTFHQVVFDPPHLLRVGESSYMFAKYGKLDHNTWQEDLKQGFDECFRVLATNGTLIFKWNEIQIPVSEILALTPYDPLYGHRSGKRSNTHWISFIK